MKDHSVADTTIRDGAIFLGIVLLVYISTNITPITVETVVSGEAPAVLLSLLLSKVDPDTIKNLFLSLHNFFAIIGILFLGGSIWATLKINEIHHKEHKKYEPIPLEEVAAKEKFTQWQVVLDHVNSESPAEWKLAILEADNILDEVLDDLGYVGETVAEKLKTMSPTKIASYDDIWVAHKLRNQIAHGGAIDMELSKKSARDAIAKFEKAFKELGYL